MWIVEASKGMHVQRKKNLKDKSHIIIFLINMQCLQEPQKNRRTNYYCLLDMRHRIYTTFGGVELY